MAASTYAFVRYSENKFLFQTINKHEASLLTTRYAAVGSEVGEEFPFILSRAEAQPLGANPCLELKQL